MAVADAVGPTPGGLATRVVVGLGLSAIALGALWFGGLAFAALVAAAGLLMSAEWSVMHRVPRGVRLASLAVLALVGAVAVNVSARDALIGLIVAAVLTGLFMRRFDRARAVWVALGLLYCGLPMIALLWLRGHIDGLAIVAWVFAVVWSTDIAAFFAGRAIGGRRLAPAISPNKTVAGLLGGVAAAAVAGALIAAVLDARTAADFMPFGLAVAGALLAVLAQAGDLFESWLKRRAGVKDSGNLLPGHGGVLDRLDGLVPVAVTVALVVSLVPGWVWQ